jgi:hypothetical protein
MGPQEHKLCEALEDWRDQKTVEIYGCSHLIDLGPTVVMGDTVLDQIIDCTHHEKIKVIQDLHKETHWSINDNLAREVIAIIHQIIPISLYTTAPLQQHPLSTTVNTPISGLPQCSSLASNNPPAGTKKVQKCSACGQPGHNSEFLHLFSLYSHSLTLPFDQNVAVFVHCIHHSYLLLRRKM